MCAAARARRCCGCPCRGCRATPPGHAGLQDARGDRGRTGARSAPAAAQVPGAGGDLPRRSGRRSKREARSDVDVGARARSSRGRRSRRRPSARHVIQRAARRRQPDVQAQGGQWRGRLRAARQATDVAQPEGARINMLTAIRRTLEHELAINPRVAGVRRGRRPQGRRACGDAGAAGTSSATTRVFDTSLSEEGIIGRAVGMALAGLMPVPEIQFRKYAEPAAEQLNDCGTMRWRTDNRFAAPMVVRMPGGFFKCGDPWHSQTQRGAVRARRRLAGRGAVERRGRGRPAALGAARQRSGDLLRASRDARRRLGAPALSGRRFRAAVRPGEAACARDPSSRSSPGARWWSAASRRPPSPRSTSSCSTCARSCPGTARRCSPRSRKTRRCLIVHEDTLTAGFGAEIAAVVAERGVLRPRRADRARSRCPTSRARTARCCSMRWCRALANRARRCAALRVSER